MLRHLDRFSRQGGAAFVTCALSVACSNGTPSGSDNVARATQALGSSGGIWAERGPAPISQVDAGFVNTMPTALTNLAAGAVQAVVGDPVDANTVYVGSVGGGVFKTTNAGAVDANTAGSVVWQALTDDMPSLSIGALAMDPADRLSLAAGTTNRDSSYGHSGPIGYVYVTHDGQHFTVVNAPQTRQNPVSAVLIWGNTLLVGTESNPGGLYLGTAPAGTTNYTFQSVGGHGDLPAAFGPVRKLVRDPTNNNRVYLGVSAFNGAGSGIYRSDDNGNNWTRVSTNETSGALTRALLYSDNIRLSTARDGRLYALVTALAQPVYIGYSADQGASWTAMELPRWDFDQTDLSKPRNTSVQAVSQVTLPNSNTLATLVTTPIAHQYSVTGFAGNTRVRITDASKTIVRGDFNVIFAGTQQNPSTTQFYLLDIMSGSYVTGLSVAPGDLITPFHTTQVDRALVAAIAADPTDSTLAYVSGHAGDSFYFGEPESVVLRCDPTKPANNAIPTRQWIPIVGNGTTSGTEPHTEVRDMAFDAAGRLLHTSDGGIVRHDCPRGSCNQQAGDWVNLNGDLGSVQPSDVAIDPVSGAFFVGVIDNGTAAQDPTLPGTKTTWPEITGADGGDVQAVLDKTVTYPASVRYLQAELGGLSRQTFAQNGQATLTSLPLLVNGTALPKLQPAPFNTPYGVNRAPDTQAAAPCNGRNRPTCDLVIGWSDGVYESYDRGNTFVKLDGSPQYAHSLTYGHPLNEGLLWAAAQSGLYRRVAVGVGMGRQDNFPGEPFAVTDSPDNDDYVYVSGLDSSGRGSVWASSNGTQSGNATWTDVTGDLPQPLGVPAAIVYVKSPNGDRVIIAASDRDGADVTTGVFMMTVPNFGVWTRVGTNLPAASAVDLAYDDSRDLLAVATAGRGVWTMTGLKTLDRAPVAQCKNVSISVDSSCHGSITTADVDGGSTDPDGNALSCTATPTGPFSPSVQQVKLTCTDPTGAASACDATVSVVDNTPPVFTSVPPDLTTTQCTAPNLGRPTATDACGAVTITNDAPTKFPPGTTLVHWYATDPSGRTSVATQRVTLEVGNDASCCPAGSHVIMGTPNNDTLTGTSGADCIIGLGGQDRITGGGGNDVISGGDGDDVISGDAGDDVISGGPGQDHITGGDGNDVIVGDAGDDVCSGGNGNDVLLGGAGQDQLSGDANDDTLNGGPGFDRLDGGLGTDVCSAGGDVDTYTACETRN